MTTVAEIDPHDEPSLRAFWEAEQAAIRADRHDPVTRSWEALRSQVQRPSRYHERTLLAVRDGAATVGAGELLMWREGNPHLASLEVHVVPGHRRRGIGRILFEDGDRRRLAAGRTTVLGEVNVAHGADLTATAAGAFARAMGMESVHTEDRLQLRLPVADDLVAGLQAKVGAAASAYEIVVWGNHCPDEHVAGYCAMNTQMSADVPSGDLDVEPIVWDEERMRASEERTAAAYDRVVAAARRRADGVFGGYSLLFLPRGVDHVFQDDTLVMPEHRGHRLGTALKLATLEVLRREHPARTHVNTWTEPDNDAMYRTNLDFGYRPVEQMHEVQRKDPPA